MQWSGCYASRLFSRVLPSSCLMFLMHKEGHKPSYTSFFLGPICGWKKNFKMCRSQRSLVVIVMMTMMVMMKILLEEKDILISDPISGGTDPDHCICLPSLTAIIILFHNAALSYSEIIINHTLIIKNGLINE